MLYRSVTVVKYGEILMSMYRSWLPFSENTDEYQFRVNDWSWISFWSYNLRACDRFQTPTLTGCRNASCDDFFRWMATEGLQNVRDFIKSICRLSTLHKDEDHSWIRNRVEYCQKSGWEKEHWPASQSYSLFYLLLSWLGCESESMTFVGNQTIEFYNTLWIYDIFWGTEQ